MTNAQHTLGPWQYQPTAGNHDFLIYSESDGRDIALVRDSNEANARLIAAAPELLNALETLMLRWGDYIAMGDTPGENPKYITQAKEYGDKARAAIAKAKGE